MTLNGLYCLMDGNQNIKIDREKLYRMYMKKVMKIADECDWVTNFTPEDIVGMICDIIEEKKEDLIKFE